MKDTILDLKTLQDVLASHSRVLNAEETVETLLPFLVTEVAELIEAQQMNDPIKIKSELADIIIFSVHMLTALGVPLEDVLNAKINRNFVKYNPHHIRQLQEQRYTLEEARKIMKGVWPPEADNHFME